MLDVQDWTEIRRLRRAEGMSISQIARVVGLARNTVKAALSPSRYRRKPAGSLVDGLNRGSGELLQAYLTMAATVIAEAVGWPYSIRTLSSRGADLQPVYLPPDPPSRTSYVVGEIAQCDFWFPDSAVLVGFGQTRTATVLPVPTMVTGYSRWASAVLIPTPRAEDLFTRW